MALFFTKNLYFRIKNFFMTPFFTQLVLSHASDNTTSRNIGGTDAWSVGTVPHLKFWGDRPPVPPKSPPMHSSALLLRSTFRWPSDLWTSDLHELSDSCTTYLVWLSGNHSPLPPGMPCPGEPTGHHQDVRTRQLALRPAHTLCQLS